MQKWARANFQPNLPLGEDNQRVTACKAHLDLARQAAAEGMVLLKNEQSVLPLPNGSSIALFGKATFDYVQGGGGSGEVHSAYRRNLYEGLQQKGDAVHIYEPLADFYRHNVAQQLAQGAVFGLTYEPIVPPELVEGARGFANTAIISVCRFSGEGWDRKGVVTTQADRLWSNIDGPAQLSAKLFPEGDFYLTDTEAQMIAAVQQQFDRVIVVLNIGGIFDTSWCKDNSDIQCVLLTWTAGMEGGLAAADILLGHINPSGRLADTCAQSLDAYPSTQSFQESLDFVAYTEDIYVGYRYFETFPNAKQLVNYPFGYGLSYTSFSICLERYTTEYNCLTFAITVTNTGLVPGKEVAQLYCAAPQGLLGKPARALVGFAKTDCLLPNQTQHITLRVCPKSLASFDDLGKIQKACFVLERGDYQFYLGNNVRDAQLTTAVYHVSADTIAQPSASKLTPSQLPHRLLSTGAYEALPQCQQPTTPTNMLPVLTIAEMECLTPKVTAQDSKLFIQPYKKGCFPLLEVAQGHVELDAFSEQLSNEELAHLLGGQPNTGVGITFGWGNLADYGIPNIITADGPAGVRIQPWVGITATAWPCATLLACTWNEQLVYQVGRAGAAEVKENNMGVWLTPAINIHRSPLCGRNFEYYSEDPFLTGKLASAMVQGIQSQQISACVKHFAFNNKETNRKYSDSRVSERAAREIYLKAFEIVVKEAQPWAIMSSYNLINGCRCAQSSELLQDILRDDWGFDGLVTTDWWAYSEHYLEILAGNDVKMGLGYPERILAALEQGLLLRSDLLRSARRLLRLILRMS